MVRKRCSSRECQTCASGLVVKSNVAIVGPRVRFSAGAWTFLFIYPFLVYFIYRLKPPTHTCPFHVQLSISVSMAMRLGIINPCHSFATRLHCHWSPSTPPSHPPSPPSASVTPHKDMSPGMILLAHHWLSRPTTEPSPHPTKMEEINECSSIPPLFGKKYHLSSSTRPHSTIISLFVKGSTATPQAIGADQLQYCHFPYLAASLPHRNLWP